jgi:peptidoglycan/LPS O-acetylase OafA/YrhL
MANVATRRDEALGEAAAAAPVPIAANPYRFFGTFRFALAVLVLTSHASNYLGPPFPALQLGNAGVFLFFVVSGAVISEALDIFYRSSSLRFMINRCLKIYPAYWAAVILYYAIFAVTQPESARTDAWAILVNVTFLLCYLPAGNNLTIIDIAWAILVEFQFYVIAAAVFWLARRTRRPGAALVLAGVLALAMYGMVDATDAGQRFYGFFRFAPYFVLGSAIYYGYTRKMLAPMLLAVAALAFSLHAYTVYTGRAQLPAGHWPDVFGARGDIVATTMLFVLGVGLFCWLIGRSFGPAARQADRRLGDVTYALYLIHPAVISIAAYLALPGGVAYGFVLVVSLILATAIFRGVERPLMRFRNIFRGRRLYD